jgi:uncharacterized membrane protein
VKKLKISKERRQFLTMFSVILLVSFMISYMTTTPRPKEEFFQFCILGEEKTAAKYYPNDNSTIKPNVEIRWYVSVENYMGTLQYVLVKVKLGNETLAAPDEINAIPADLPIITEFRRLLMDNETWEISFTWMITDITSKNDMVFLTLEVNGKAILIMEVGARDGRRFRMIFELWTLDKESGDFIFGWKARGSRKVAWLQLWFNATKVR